MGWTKLQFANAALEELGLASYVFDLSPEQLNSALTRLDAMMASWNAKGIRLGYPLPGSPENSDITAETGVPDSANEAIYTNLAIKLAPTYGKIVAAETRYTAKCTFDTLLSRAAVPPQMQLPDTLPVGAGNKPWGTSGPYFPKPSDPILSGSDGEIEFT